MNSAQVAAGSEVRTDSSPHERQPLLDIDGLRVRFETQQRVVHAVNGVDVSVHAGEVFALVGESGSGKSASMLSLMGLLESPSARVNGSIQFNGRELTSLSRRKMNSIRARLLWRSGSTRVCEPTNPASPTKGGGTMNKDADPATMSLVDLEEIGDCEVLRNITDQPGIETVEGRLVPLLSGDAIKSHIIVMHPGQYASAHAHETESIIYTMSGSWVFCTTENGEEKRTVINQGDLFRFPGGAPTGFETPFDDPAVILILKGGSYSYQDMIEGMLEARSILDGQAAEGEPFSYTELEPDHPAIAYAEEVSGRNPAEHFASS